MEFLLFNNDNRKNVVELIHSAWDDWFRYETLYTVYYYDEDGIRNHLGAIKIGQINQQQRIPGLEVSFTTLSEDFFSLGQDVSYYESLNKYGDDFRVHILSSLNDIAFNEEIYTRAIKEHVTKISLLRSVSTASVIGQFRRLAQGNSLLTEYKFKYIAPKIKNEESRMELDFSVIPNSNPPTNLHVIVGRNGVGKTFLLNNMISSLVDETSSTNKVGEFVFGDNNNEKVTFANVISVSFSAFDEIMPLAEIRDKTKGVKYSYIGLKRINSESSKLLPPKSPVILKNEFVKSVEQCRLMSKTTRWQKALKLLESDPIFKESGVSKIAEINLNDNVDEFASPIFKRLSSGHKIVLLTITRLVEAIEEKSLVLLDEPEGYLHPPLLSAFIRAISELLIYRNAVAIVATHSPVVLQEVPRSCVWKLRRTGTIAKAERLELESFGENVGVLTQEIFGLEVTDSGFHKLLKDTAAKYDNYEDAVSSFNEELGNEAKGIIRNLFLLKKKQYEED